MSRAPKMKTYPGVSLAIRQDGLYTAYLGASWTILTGLSLFHFLYVALGCKSERGPQDIALQEVRVHPKKVVSV